MKQVLEWEDGSEVGGSGAQFSLFPAGTPSQSSEEQSEQPTESQLIWSLAAKNCRGQWKTVRRVRWDCKVPGICIGTKAAAAPGPVPAAG